MEALLTAKLSPSEINILSALFARSNMGQLQKRDYTEVKAIIERLREPSRRDVTLSSAVIALCEQFMESDEHQNWFEDEARGWLAQNNRADAIEVCKRTHYDLAYLFGLHSEEDARKAAEAFRERVNKVCAAPKKKRRKKS